METTGQDPAFFVRARPKKGMGFTPSKRKRASKVEEIAFDFTKREDYLTGFHKRKVERIKRAQAENAKKEKEEKIQQRKELRQERKQELEEHVNAVNTLLEEQNVDFRKVFAEDGEDDEWDGIKDASAPSALEPVDHEEEYIDEDKYTTVTIEEVDVDKDGIHTKSEEERAAEKAKAKAEAAAKKARDEAENKAKMRKQWPKKEKKAPFRYESKIERKLGREKLRNKNKKAKAARTGDD